MEKSPAILARPRWLGFLVYAFTGAAIGMSMLLIGNESLTTLKAAGFLLFSGVVGAVVYRVLYGKGSAPS